MNGLQCTVYFYSVQCTVHCFPCDVGAVAAAAVAAAAGAAAAGAATAGAAAAAAVGAAAGAAAAGTRFITGKC